MCTVCLCKNIHDGICMDNNQIMGMNFVECNRNEGCAERKVFNLNSFHLLLDLKKKKK